jgi:type I pantothenate kinase
VTRPAVNEGFETYTRGRWAALADRGQGAGIERLVATDEPVPAEEVIDIYLPLSQLLGLLVASKAEARRRISAFVGEERPAAPFIIGIAGSVAVGKSTVARVLQSLLQLEGSASVDLLTTDGFLYPNAILARRGLMNRKGFPESYDLRSLIGALASIRAGDPEVETPVYSHVSYDIVPDAVQVLRRADIVIVEGLNVLQVNTKGDSAEQTLVSDFFDFSIYVDAAEEDIARWFAERLAALRSAARREGGSHPLAALPESEVASVAQHVWEEVNAVNLRDNVAPTRRRAHLILEKDGDHHVRQVLLRPS